MVALDIVHASNARLHELGPGLVAIFVGATSGIGEYTAKAFVKDTISPHVYIVGRNQDAASRIIKECEALNKDGKVEFIKADVSQLSDVDHICEKIVAKEKRINLLFQSQGNLNFRGRDESNEGLDRKMVLNYYSRMRFISNLLPLLRTASTTPPHFSRSVSVLGAGYESSMNMDDIELKKTFSAGNCAAHTTVMNDFMVEKYAAREPGTTFIHTSPGVVNTGIARELPAWARLGLKAFTPILSLFMVGHDETGERQLFMATSGIFPPLKPAGGAASASGVTPQNLEVAKGASGPVGRGGYLLSWKCEVTGRQKLLSEYREKGVAEKIWEHTASVFERVKKINEGPKSLKKRGSMSLSRREG